jgi:hypothetical protein
LTGIVALEYQTAHNAAMKSIYEENEFEVKSLEDEQEAMFRRLKYLQKQIKKELEPSRIKKPHEHRLFEIIFGQNTDKLKMELP